MVRNDVHEITLAIGDGANDVGMIQVCWQQFLNWLLFNKDNTISRWYCSYCSGIMIIAIVNVHPVDLMNTDSAPGCCIFQIKPTYFGSESAYRLLPYASSIPYYRYYSAWKLMILSHGWQKAEGCAACAHHSGCRYEHNWCHTTVSHATIRQLQLEMQLVLKAWKCHSH